MKDGLIDWINEKHTETFCHFLMLSPASFISITIIFTNNLTALLRNEKLAKIIIRCSDMPIKPGLLTSC